MRTRILVFTLSCFTLWGQEPVDRSTPNATPNSTNPPAIGTVDTNAPVANEPIPYPQTQNTNTAPKPKVESKPKFPPKTFGDCTGEFWIGQRIVSERHAGWGWIKRQDDSWNSAKWVMLQEKPGKMPAPGRFYSSPNADDNMQYRFYGTFASYKGYEPNIDSMVDVFVLKGFEVLGPGDPIKRKLPGPTGSKPGRISERGSVSEPSLFGE